MIVRIDLDKALAEKKKIDVNSIRESIKSRTGSNASLKDPDDYLGFLLAETFDKGVLAAAEAIKEALKPYDLDIVLQYA